LHDFIDSSKAHFADVRHRALLHSSFGIFLVEQIFGDRTVNDKGEIVKHPYITNSQGIKVQVRDIAEQHVLDDLGKIPSVGDYLQHMELQTWMGGPVIRSKKSIKIEESYSPETFDVD
jgi:hypothetical protein